jgi:hypothetical protein
VIHLSTYLNLLRAGCTTSGAHHSIPYSYRVYACLVCEAAHRTPGTFKDLDFREPGDVEPASSLVTPARLSAGLEVLRRMKNGNATASG